MMRGLLNAVTAGRRKGAAKYLRANDLALLAKMPLVALAAWALPERLWDNVAAAVAMEGRAKAERMAAHLDAYLHGTGLGASAEAIRLGHDRNVRVSQAQYLRCYHPRGWRPNIRFEGREHLDCALGAGRGAILWVAPFIFAPLLAKMAVHAAGYQLVHLSSQMHGGSSTRMGIKLINPVRVAVENRFLAERVVIGEGGPGQAMRTLTRRLGANRTLSITVAAMGVKRCTVPFLAGELQVATGAPNLSLRSGAPLLPVFVLREQPGQFLVTIEPPLQADPALDRDQATRDLVVGLAARIEAHARRQPDQFHWHADITAWRNRTG